MAGMPYGLQSMLKVRRMTALRSRDRLADVHPPASSHPPTGVKTTRGVKRRPRSNDRRRPRWRCQLDDPRVVCFGAAGGDLAAIDPLDAPSPPSRGVLRVATIAVLGVVRVTFFLCFGSWGWRCRMVDDEAVVVRAVRRAAFLGADLTSARPRSSNQDGHKHMSGLDEAVIKNVEACKQLSKITRTSLGPNGASRPREMGKKRGKKASSVARALTKKPRSTFFSGRPDSIGHFFQISSLAALPFCSTGMNKMVINHLDKLFVTSDAAVIVRELEVAHPAAKLLVMAAQAQEQEIGDGTNLVVTFGGELLGMAEELIRDGLHPSEIIEGYEKALKQALVWLEELVLPGSETLDLKDKIAVAERLKGTLSSKQFGLEEMLAKTCTEACIDVCPKNPQNFNVDNVRVAKIIGSSLHQNEVIQGMVIRRDCEGTVKHVTDAKVAVFGCAVDTASTETKGTVMITSAADLEAYSKGEEQKMEEYIKMIADSGAKVVVSGQSFGEMAMHFIERYGLMAIKMPSKFELRRFCRATNATGIIKLGRPSADELGYVSAIDIKEIGGTKCVVVQQKDHTSRVATVILRGSTENSMDDIERAVDDGVNAFKALAKDSRTLPAGGATEIELAHRLAAYGRKQTGLDQYAIEKFSKALEVVPRTLAENAGLNATDVVYNLYAAHAAGEVNAGVDVSAEKQWVNLAETDKIADVYLVKWWALKLAVEAVTTVLRVDQIIMAKQAGGPKGGPGGDED